jgi:hypothetical protein
VYIAGKQVKIQAIVVKQHVDVTVHVHATIKTITVTHLNNNLTPNWANLYQIRALR